MGATGNAMTTYKQDMVARYWGYQQQFFPETDAYFERPFAPDGRPPVFLPREAWRNVLVDPDASQQEPPSCSR